MKKLIAILAIMFSSVLVVEAQVNSLSNYYQELNKKYTRGVFRSDNAVMLVPMDEDRTYGMGNVLQYLQGRVPSLRIYNSWHPNPQVSYRGGYPAFFVDEMQVDVQTLQSINVRDIAIVKLFRPPFIGAFRGGPNGAIAVYTKDGDED